MRRFALFVPSVILICAIGLQARSLAAPRTSAQDTPDSRTSMGEARAPMPPAQLAELRADVLMARKEYAAAIDAYQGVLKDKPKDAALLNKIGVAYQELGANDSAAKYYKRSMSANKKLANPVNNLGTLEYGLKHYSKAVNYYKRALGLSSPSATLYSNLGYAYYADKKMELAMECFNKAVAIDPGIFDSHPGSGGSVIQQRTAPDPGTFNFMVAKTYAKAGDVERAARYLKLARDYGYKDMASVEKDKDFAAVIKDPKIQDVLRKGPTYTDVNSQTSPN